MGVWNWLHFYPFPALEWTKNVTGKWSIFHIFDKFFSFFKNHLFLRFPQVHTRKMRAKKASKVSVKKYQTPDFDQICRILLKCFESKVSKIKSKWRKTAYSTLWFLHFWDREMLILGQNHRKTDLFNKMLTHRHKF